MDDQGNPTAEPTSADRSDPPKDDQVNPAVGSTSADRSDPPKDEAQQSPGSNSPFSETAAKLTQELATVEKLVEIVIRALANTEKFERATLRPMAVHATGRALKTFQLIKENHEKVSQREFLLIVEEVVDFKTKELARLLNFESRQQSQIDKVTNEIFSFC